MRVTQIHVKDGKSVREYAYREDRNISYRPDMEDSKSLLTQIMLSKIPSSTNITDCMLSLTGMGAHRSQSFALFTYQQYPSIKQDFQGGIREGKFKHTTSLHQHMQED